MADEKEGPKICEICQKPIKDHTVEEAIVCATMKG